MIITDLLHDFNKNCVSLALVNLHMHRKQTHTHTQHTHTFDCSGTTHLHIFDNNFAQKLNIGQT